MRLWRTLGAELPSFRNSYGQHCGRDHCQGDRHSHGQTRGRWLATDAGLPLRRINAVWASVLSPERLAVRPLVGELGLLRLLERQRPVTDLSSSRRSPSGRPCAPVTRGAQGRDAKESSRTSRLARRRASRPPPRRLPMTPPTCRALGPALRRSPAPTSTPAQPQPRRSPSRR